MRRKILILGAAAVVLYAIVSLWWASRRGEEFSQLDSQKQDHIWRLEHVTFEIEGRLGKGFLEALTRGDAEALSRYFAQGFRGWLLGARQAVTQEVSGVTQRRYAGNENPSEPLPAGTSEMVDFFLQARERFVDPQRLSFRVLHIDSVAGHEGRFRTKLLVSVFGAGPGGATLDWATEQQVVLQFAEESELSFGPVLKEWRLLSDTLRSSPAQLMEEVTTAAGLDQLDLPDNWKLSKDLRHPYRFQAAVADFDNDGFADIVVASHEKHYLLRSVRGERFEDVTPRLPSIQGSHLLAWVDYDNDGDPDLIFRDRLLRNDRGERFVDVTEASGLEFKHEPTGCAVADFDRDGRLDLYVTYVHEKRRDGDEDTARPWVGDSQSGLENQLWRNRGDGRFVNVTKPSGAGAGKRASFAAVWFYYDADPWPDLYVANDFGENVLLRNRGDGTFEDISRRSEAADFATSMGVAAGDLDNDGLSELYVANMYSKMGRRIIAHVGADDYPQGVFAQIQGSCAGNRLYRRTAEAGSFREISAPAGVNAVGWAYAPAMADFNNDGYLDLYATTGYMSFHRDKPDG